MEPEDVRALYDADYAARYHELWQESPEWGPEADLYVRTIGEHLPEGGRWLDVGCGTGWFLSQFPDVERAGVDISPAMLARAREGNPGIELREGNIKDDIPEWHGQWDLVTSTGQAWGYLDTVDQVGEVAANMAGWTSPDGVLLVQPPDLNDLTGGAAKPDFDLSEPQADDAALITGVVWSYFDHAGVHHNQVYPSLPVWVHWLSQHFLRVDVITWPHEPPPPRLAVARRLVVGSRKRAPGDDTKAEVVVHPAPEPAVVPDPEPEPAPEPEPVVVEEAAPPAPEPVAEEPVAPATPDAAAVPTATLLREVARRSSPTDARVWTTLARAVKKKAASRRR